MSIEKKIRTQAKEKLNGNWGISLTSLFIALALFIISLLYFEIILGIANVWDEDGNIKENSAIYVTIASLVSVAFIVFVSPAKNGILRVFYNIANGRGAGIADIFHYFKDGRYLKTLGFNLILALKKIIKAFACFFLFYVAQGVSTLDTQNQYTALFVIIQTFLFAGGATLWILWNLKYFLSEFIYIDDENIDISTVFSITNHIIKRHRSDVYMLWCTFLPWAALCFFVLPALYVIPYALTSAATSTKWLVKIYKDGRMI